MHGKEVISFSVKRHVHIVHIEMIRPKKIYVGFRFPDPT